MEQIFSKEQQEKARFILNHPLAKLSDLRSNEIKDLAVNYVGFAIYYG